MDNADIPIKIPLAFAIDASGSLITYPIPTDSQIGIDNGRASFETGFVPLNFVPIQSGGVPPFGKDFNGLLRQVTSGLRWLQAGGPLPYDAGWVAVNGGYPEGALIASTTVGLFWISTIDNNTGDPDAGAPNWLPAPIANVRRRLAANLDLFVSPSGSDANNGLTIGTPFATLQHATTLIQNGYDLNGFRVLINVAPGTFSAGMVLSGAVPGAVNPSSIAFVANGGEVTVNGVGTCFGANQGALISLEGNGWRLGAVLSSGIGSPIIATGGSIIELRGVVNFAAAEGAHVAAATGGQVRYLATEEISGGAPAHFSAHACGVITANAVGVAITGTPNFTGAYASTDEGGIIEAQGYTVTSGSTTGARYSAILGGVINTYGGGPNVFPGDAAGSSPTGYYA